MLDNQLEYLLKTCMIKNIINTIDNGCTNIDGLKFICESYREVCGPGKIFNHPKGILFVANDGYTVLIELNEKDE